MVREYIGARYVPKFMGTYDPSQIYEALCVVDNGLGTSYISKVPTPAGTPLTDADYWAIYGASSGAIINLQNQIDDMNDGSVAGSLQNQINDIVNTDIPAIQTELAAIAGRTCWRNKRIVIVGDSYADTSPTDFAYLIQSANIFNRVDIVAGGGWGFTGKDGAGSGPTGPTYEWLTHFTTFVNGLSDADKDEISDVFIIGGFNDHYSSEATIDSHMSTFFAYANAALPNAQYHLGLCAWANNGSITTPNETTTGAAIRLAISTTVLTSYQKCVNYGCDFMGAFIKPLHDYVNGFDYTNYHPSTTASAELAKEILSAMIGKKLMSSTSYEQNIKVNNVETQLGVIRFDGDTMHFMTTSPIIVLSPNSTTLSGNIIEFHELSLSTLHNFIGNRSATIRQGIDCLARVNASGQPYYRGMLYLDTDDVFKMRLPFACVNTDVISLIPQNCTISMLDC